MELASNTDLVKAIEATWGVLNGSQGVLVAILSWMGLLRVGAKPVSNWLQAGLSRLLAFVQGTPEQDDDLLLARLLSSKGYRAIAFVVDWAASVKLPNTATMREANPASLGRAGLLLSTLFAVLLLSMGAGCVRTLAPGGPYTNVETYATDESLGGSYELIQAFIEWETANRATLKGTGVTEAADKLRDRAPALFKTAVKLRDAYVLDPSGANREAWQKALATLRAAAAEAAGYMLAN